MLVNLAGGLVEREFEVDFLTRRRDAPYLNTLNVNVRLIETGKSGLISVLPMTIRYLKANRPDYVLCGKDRAGHSAVLAKWLSGVPFGLVMRPGTTISERLARRTFIKRWKAYYLIRRIYRQATAVVGNSAGVVHDISTIAGLPPERMHLIRNPVVTHDIYERAQAPVSRAWLEPGHPPIILGIGGLRHQKGFDTLIRAFAKLRQARPCRLVILGEGHLRVGLERLAEQLNIAADVILPGFEPEPYPVLSRSDLFVLSSRWEGSPNALCEALALGTPVVATDCPSGPREILRGGSVAPLVPVDDVEAMALAMSQALDAPGNAEERKAAVAEYTVDICAARYAALFESLSKGGV
jgi:glycosyltransferase involved in cell wall biosynthesis